jgi:hypothetical protein
MYIEEAVTFLALFMLQCFLRTNVGPILINFLRIYFGISFFNGVYFEFLTNSCLHWSELKLGLIHPMGAMIKTVKLGAGPMDYVNSNLTASSIRYYNASGTRGLCRHLPY